MHRNFDIDSGSTFWGSDGKKIGTAKDCTDTYCHIDTGFLGLGPDYYVPFDAISDVRGNDVYLNVPSDQIKDLGWDREPGEVAGMTSGTMGGTMPREGYRSDYREGYDRDTEARDRGTTGESMSGPSTRSMPLREEELRTQRHGENVGDVTIGKHVVEEQRTVDVPTSHEEVNVRQRPVDRPSHEPIGEGGEIRVPVREEHVSVEKEPHVYSEIDVEKQRVTGEKPVTETVRKEVPDVGSTGNAGKFVERREGNWSDKDRRDNETDEEYRARHERELRDRDRTDRP